MKFKQKGTSHISEEIFYKSPQNTTNRKSRNYKEKEKH